jgi:hypothetical protein
MYIFAEPVTDEQADEIQSAGEAAQKEFAQRVVGIGKDDPEVQAAWHSIQDTVDEQVDEDHGSKLSDEAPGEDVSEQKDEAVSEQKDEKESEQNVEEGSKQNGVEGPKQKDPEVPEKGREEVPEQEDATETTGEQSSDESEKSGSAAQKTPIDESIPEPVPHGPLMGWTLTIRNKVNDGYTDRPTKLTAEDEWKIEYHVQEIPEASRWRLYTAVKERRRGLVGHTEEADKSLKNYRDLIQRFSNRGRKWREKQDKLDEEMGIQVYKPLGPGSGAATTDGSDKEN